MPTAPPTAPVPAQSALRYAAEVKRRWRAGAEPDALAALAGHADLAGLKSVVIDLAYEEFCLRERAGERPDPAGFCARFPRYRTSIRNVLDVHRLAADRPDLLAADPGDWPAVGSWFEGLELLGELGRGAFGRAYLAFDPQTDRPCVLKLSAGRSAEARVIGSVRHPHVTDVYWSRPVGRLTAVCMPLLGTSTLAEVLDAAFPGGPGEPPATAAAILDAIEPVGAPDAAAPVVRPGEPYPVGVAALAARVADALRHLHAGGTSHGDLKPSNVVLAPGGHPYLIDFNLSATADRPPAAVGGTLPYMAPEQLRLVLDPGAGPADPAKADVYALGVLTFELLTGRLPAAPPGAADPAAAAADLLARPAEADAALPGVPRPLARVVRRCLAADPARRPTAAEAARDLEAYLRAARGGRRPTRWAGAAALACGVAAAAVWAASSGAPAGPAPAAVVEPQREKRPETADEAFARGLRYLHEGDLPPAMADFAKANQLRREPRFLAYMAYCAARMGQPNVAAALGREAIDAGAAWPRVFNNLGYSLIKNGQPQDALRPLDVATERAPALQAGWYNRALARHLIATAVRGPGFDPRAAEDMDAALARDPKSDALYFDAAQVYATGAGRDPALRAKAIRCLAAAVELGKDPTGFKDGPAFQVLTADPAFQRLLTTKPGPPGPPPSPRLLEPVSP